MVDHKFLVGIRCNTYNQAKYITDALNGFAMQQTTFPFVAMVVDDASTDGEREVITDYLKANFDIENTDVAYQEETEYAYITFAQHNTNKNCYFAVLLLKENHYQKKLNYKKFDYIARWRETTKYEALCEGDDYWIDPQKLQKQVDFLENNPEYGLVHTNFDATPCKRINNKVPINDEDNYLFEIINHNYRIATQTVVYRLSMFALLPKYYTTQNFKMGDLPLWIEFAKLAKIKYLKDKTAIYRVLDDSASHSSDKNKELAFIKSGYDCSAFYINKYNLNIKLNKRGFYIASMKIAFKHQDKDLANTLIKDAFNEKYMCMRLLVFYFGVHFKLVRFCINLLYYKFK